MEVIRVEHVLIVLRREGRGGRGGEGRGEQRSKIRLERYEQNHDRSLQDPAS